MASIKFLIQSKSHSAPVYCRLSLARNQVFKRKTQFLCDATRWNANQGLPKGNDEGSKKLKLKLERLRVQILDQLNEDLIKGAIIDGRWLESVTDPYNLKTDEKNLNLLTDFADYYLEHLPNKTGAKKATKLAPSTIKQNKTIVNKLKKFEAFKKRRFRLLDVDLRFHSEFSSFLVEIERIGERSLGRYLRNVKTIILAARKEGKEVSPQIEHFKGFTSKAPKVYLSFDELASIKSVKLNSSKLEAARDWLIISCYTGQRASDLLRMNADMIIKERAEDGTEHEMIRITQEKTGKQVLIPIHPEVNRILKRRNGTFPETFARTMESCKTLYNRYLKELGKQAGLTGLTEGNRFNPETKRTELGHYEKWQLLSSHIGRRSFATNFYSTREYPTPLLMNITGHSTEKEFLNYIGRKPSDLSIQLAKQWTKR